MKSTNYLNPTMFYNDYLDWLVLLDEFHNDDSPPPMSAQQFYFEERIRYGSGLRVTEGINLIKLDFDEEHFHTCLAQPVIEKPFVKPLIEVVNQ